MWSASATASLMVAEIPNHKLAGERYSPVVPPWYRMHRPMRPGSPPTGTMGTAGTPPDGSTPSLCRLGAERSLVQIQSPRLSRLDAYAVTHAAAPPAGHRSCSFTEVSLRPPAGLAEDHVEARFSGDVVVVLEDDGRIGAGPVEPLPQGARAPSAIPDSRGLPAPDDGTVPPGARPPARAGELATGRCGRLLRTLKAVYTSSTGRNARPRRSRRWARAVWVDCRYELVGPIPTASGWAVAQVSEPPERPTPS